MGTLQGAGVTGFQKQMDMVLDKVAPGTSSLPASLYRTQFAPASIDSFVQQNILHRTGASLILCGVFKLGDNAVCGK
jgi:hypothetical protein